MVSLREALNAAREINLDLVEVSPTAKPPVCRILDWGKYHYTQMKRARESRRAHQVTEMKEVRLRPKTNEYHAGFKVDDARRFLQKKMKVRFKVQFRGREITYPEIALKQLQEVAATLHDIAEIEQKPNLDGRTMVMVLTPRGEVMSRKPEALADGAVAAPKPAAPAGGTPPIPKRVRANAKKVEPAGEETAGAEPESTELKAEGPAVEETKVEAPVNGGEASSAKSKSEVKAQAEAAGGDEPKAEMRTETAAEVETAPATEAGAAEAETAPVAPDAAEATPSSDEVERETPSEPEVETTSETATETAAATLST